MYSAPPPAPARLRPQNDLRPLVAALDWSATALGPMDGWAASTRAAVTLMLASPVPMVMMWGREGTLIYNNGYAVIAGERHPQVLGMPAREAWPEVADFNGDVIETCLAGDTLSFRDQPFMLNRSTQPEEVFLDLDYSPVLTDQGEAVAVLAIVTETTAKVLAQRRVESERERLGTMFEQAPGFMAVLRGPAHIFDLANPAYMELVGHREVLGKSVREALPDVEGQGFFQILDQVYRTGEAFLGHALAATLQHAPGAAVERRYIDVLYHPLRDAFGAVAGIFVQGGDVTERVKAEEAVKQRESQFKVFAQAMPNQVWAAGPDGLLDWINAKTLEFSGLTEQDLLGNGWTSIVHPDDLAIAGEKWAHARATATNYQTEFRLRRADGIYRWHLARAVPLREDGRVSRWVGTNTDIEDQRATSDALARLNETLEQQVAERTAERDSVWRLSTDVMLVADLAGTIVSVNPAWTRLLGWSQAELIGTSFMDLVHPDDREATLDELDELGRGATTFRFENRYRCKDGRYCVLMWTAVPEKGLIHGIGRDMTSDREAADALRRTEAALYQAQKMESVGQLTGGVAHDFNNVLQIIAGNLQLLRKSTGADEAAQRRLNGALDGVRRGAKLASQLLAFARKQPLSPVVLNVGRLLRDLDDMFRRALGEAIELETVVAGGVWNVLADSSFLENALLNLAINARDAMKGHGRLTIEAGNASLDDNYALSHSEVTPGQYVMIAVSDTGCGMTEDVVLKVFEPFFTTKPDGHGTGLGLSMVYGFVKQTGGHIKIYSEVGHGTTVKIYLPRSTELEHAVEPLALIDNAGGSETILVVEDDQQVRETVVDLLGDMGYRVLKASDAQSALAVVESGVPIDLLFTDVVMPGTLRSPELAKRAKLAQPRIEVLFTSGYTENSIVHGGRLDPGVALLSKPYSRDELARKIRHLLSNRTHTEKLHDAASHLTEQSLADDSGSRNRVSLRILVVEDNADALGSMLELLLHLGHRPAGASSAEAALEGLHEAAFDVLVTDLNLPGMSGRALAEQAVVLQPNLRLVIASGEQGIDIGVPNVLWLTKPFGPQEIEAVLQVPAKDWRPV